MRGGEEQAVGAASETSGMTHAGVGPQRGPTRKLNSPERISNGIFSQIHCEVGHISPGFWGPERHAKGLKMGDFWGFSS